MFCCIRGAPSSEVDEETTQQRVSRNSNRAHLDRLKVLKTVPLLSSLPKDYHFLLAAACEKEEFGVGETVVQQGDLGTKLFLIEFGEAAVFVENAEGPVKVATMMVGDCFGEQAILFDKPRAATVTAVTELTCLSLSRATFKELGLHKRLAFPKRQAIMEVKPSKGHSASRTKSPEEISFIVKSIMGNTNLVALKLTEANAKELAETAWLEEIEDGQQIIKQDEANADAFYVVSSGAFDIFKEIEEHYGCKREDKVGTIDPGGSFGELALMYSVKRAATVKATKKSEVWVMSRAAFKSTMANSAENQVRSLVDLDRIKVFDGFEPAKMKELVAAFKQVNFNKDDVMLQEGSSNTFYILYEGEVAVMKDGVQIKTVAASRLNHTVQTFGNCAVLNAQPAAETVKVASPVASALMLDQRPLDSLRLATTPTRRGSSARPDRPKLKDAKLIGVLGQGGFGKVELRENTKTGFRYAVKIMNKDFIVAKGIQENVLNEVQIMGNLNSPFIVELIATEKAQRFIYLFMEPVLGGEIWEIYREKGLHGSYEHARYYAASVALALDHMHHHHVIYRDLKPENLMLHETGRLKVTDMGLAKFTTVRLYTTCGTPEYFSPELIRYKGQTCAVDWWALGILIFELMSASTPFAAEDEMTLLQNVLKGIGPEHFPETNESLQSIQSIVTELLQDDPSQRLTMKPGGLRNLKNHPWFSSFNWSGLQDTTLDPPYVPPPYVPHDVKKFLTVPEVSSSAWRCWKQPKAKDDKSGWDTDL